MSLSGGETVRLLIACAIALQPERIASRQLYTAHRERRLL